MKKHQNNYQVISTNNNLVINDQDNSTYKIIIDEKTKDVNINITNSKNVIVLLFLNNINCDFKKNIEITNSTVNEEILILCKNKSKILLTEETNINSKDCKYITRKRYWLKNSSNITNKIFVNHKCSNSISNVDIITLLSDSSSDTSSISANESIEYTQNKLNQKFLVNFLNNNCWASVAPIIDIKNKNNEGNHDCKIGNYDSEKQYYLEAKGLTKLEATNLLTKSYFAHFKDFLNRQDMRELDNFLMESNEHMT